jgi:hypothetical protein
VSLAAQRSELESRSQGLEARKQELDELSETLHGWHEKMQETTSEQAAPEMELEEGRKSLARWEALSDSFEKELERQRDALKFLKEFVAKRETALQERTRQLEAAEAALDARVQKAFREAVQKLQEEQRVGIQRITDWQVY